MFFDKILGLLSSQRCIRCNGFLDGSARSATTGLCAACGAPLPRIVPPVCRVCGVPLVSEAEICLRCRDGDHSFDSVRGAFLYRGRGAEIVRLYKLHDHPRLAVFLADQVAPLLAGLEGPVVPVPPRPTRLREFGWDQVDRLARHLARRCGVAVLPALRRKGGVSQKTLDSEGRRLNLVGRISSAGFEVPQECILLDDVMTTGATLSVCAEALKSAGARIVHAVVASMD